MVGLGNPGEQYAQTRHNAGYEVVERLAARHGITLRQALGKASWGHTRVGGKLLAIALPGTFMNLSGETVAPLIRRYNLDDLSHLVVVHDEVDLPLGRIHVKVGGGLAGHNGLKSIKSHVRGDDFVRVRVGVGRPTNDHQSVADYVLARPCGAEQRVFAESCDLAADAVDDLLTQGVVVAMNRYNGMA